jgi:hypothetical protein
VLFEGKGRCMIEEIPGWKEGRMISKLEVSRDMDGDY